MSCFTPLKTTAVTAATGMSRLQFKNGETLHHWSGYGDGHLDINTILSVMQTKSNYNDIKEQIKKTEVLFIDEIGLISAQMFSAVEMICRTVKDNEVVLGGIQVIASGSFFQLPPVPSCSDEGFCIRK